MFDIRELAEGSLDTVPFKLPLDEVGKILA